jgi:hypothetical protein
MLLSIVLGLPVSVSMLTVHGSMRYEPHWQQNQPKSRSGSVCSAPGPARTIFDLAPNPTMLSFLIRYLTHIYMRAFALRPPQMCDGVNFCHNCCDFVAQAALLVWGIIVDELLQAIFFASLPLSFWVLFTRICLNAKMQHRASMLWKLGAVLFP